MSAARLWQRPVPANVAALQGRAHIAQPARGVLRVRVSAEYAELITGEPDVPPSRDRRWNSAARSPASSRKTVLQNHGLNQSDSSAVVQFSKCSFVYPLG